MSEHEEQVERLRSCSASAWADGLKAWSRDFSSAADAIEALSATVALRDNALAEREARITFLEMAIDDIIAKGREAREDV